MLFLLLSISDCFRCCCLLVEDGQHIFCVSSLYGFKRLSVWWKKPAFNSSAAVLDELRESPVPEHVGDGLCHLLVLFELIENEIQVVFVLVGVHPLQELRCSSSDRHASRLPLASKRHVDHRGNHACDAAAALVPPRRRPPRSVKRPLLAEPDL